MMTAIFGLMLCIKLRNKKVTWTDKFFYDPKYYLPTAATGFIIDVIIILSV